MERVDRIKALKKIDFHWSKINKEKFRNKLKKPNFKLTPSLRYLGRFGHLQNKPKIVINEQIVLYAPLKIFKMVLLHEMCHQYVFEVLNIQDGHGKVWRRVCIRRGLDPYLKFTLIDDQVIISKTGFDID